MCQETKVQVVRLMALRPNNWTINRAKLERVRAAWRCGAQERLPPVLLAEIDGELSLIDGHSRAYAAYEHGQTHILARVEDLAQIEGSTALYTHIHRAGPAMVVRPIADRTIADLAGRIVSPRDHRRLWVGYCTRWLEENERQVCQ